MEEISIWLDTYDDLYSDFDSRKFSKRMVSEDFIYELKRNSKEMVAAPFKIVLSIPESMRRPELEPEIIDGLKKTFQKQFVFHDNEVKSLVRKGFIMTAIG